MEVVADNISCVRGSRLVFSGLSLRVGRGEFLGLLGRNGAGKTSLLRILAGFLSPAAGSVALEGAGLEDGETLQENCHYVGHLNGVKPQLSIKENLQFYKNYFSGGDIVGPMAKFSLEEIAHLPAGLLSAGQKRRVGLARLLVAPRPIWLLDEPSVSLDKQSVGLLSELLKAHLADGGIVIAATHVPLGVEFTRQLTMGQEAVS